MIRAAVISRCGRFRYSLTRCWDASLPRLVWLLCNPSTADASRDDPTVVKGIGFSDRLGYGSMIFVNCWAYRATNFADVRAARFPIGPRNNHHLRQAFSAAAGDKVIVAWGRHGAMQRRPLECLRLAQDSGCRTVALKLTDGGDPCHPLMLPYSCKPFFWGGPA